MKAKFGSILMFLGTALIFGALALFLYNQEESNTAGQAAQALMPQLIEEIRMDTGAVPDSTMPTFEVPEIYLDESDFVMTEVEIDGRMYIGYLSIPELKLELPILSDWSYPSLQVAPCRYFGTVKGGNLVLMAHNYDKHFGRISKLREGDSVVFVDMDGGTTAYEVVARDVLDPSAVEEMTAGDYDLALFTCTYGGEKRVTVYCDMA
nr:sortase [Oscillospiraceae bacterium]